MKKILLLCLACSLATPGYSQQTSTPTTPQVEGTSAKKNWLIGRWQFDQEYTQSKQGTAKGEVGVADAANAVVASQLLEKMKGATLVVTDNEITMTRGDGNGKSDRYVLIPTADSNVVQLKQEKGEVMSFHREGDRIWVNSTGSVNEPFYFKKAQE